MLSYGGDPAIPHYSMTTYVDGTNCAPVTQEYYYTETVAGQAIAVSGVYTDVSAKMIPFYFAVPVECKLPATIEVEEAATTPSMVQQSAAAVPSAHSTYSPQAQLEVLRKMLR
jgi:hypothetical protein